MTETMVTSEQLEEMKQRLEKVEASLKILLPMRDEIADLMAAEKLTFPEAIKKLYQKKQEAKQVG